MDDMIDLLIDITSRLDENGIPYFVSGSMARNLYAAPRFTNDIDIVVELHENQKSQIFALFKNDFYISEQQLEDAFKGIGFFNIVHLENSIKCDLILGKGDEFNEQCFKRRTKEAIGDTFAYFISKEDLILQKLLWRKESRSEQQLLDVKQVIKHKGSQLDQDYLIRWSKKLDVFEDLRDLL